jgi:hypothetical protein
MNGCDGGGGGGAFNYYMLKTIGTPVAISIAMYLAYKRFIYVPNPARVPFSQRKHLLRSNLFALTYACRSADDVWEHIPGESPLI